ncbi:hypothetical protein BJV82DRAFT_598304 [Fennellomyces sp. T-0311]|nr:hypothetical protein BJV82DRAFT_598304 [Fennellomyces sp. T-0311]
MLSLTLLPLLERSGGVLYIACFPVTRIRSVHMKIINLIWHSTFFSVTQRNGRLGKKCLFTFEVSQESTTNGTLFFDLPSYNMLRPSLSLIQPI